MPTSWISLWTSLMLLIGCASAEGLVTGLLRVTSPGIARFQLSTSAPMHYGTHILSQHRLAIDIFPAHLAKKYPTPGATLKQLDADTVRLQVSILHLPIYTITPHARGMTLTTSSHKLSSHRPRPKTADPRLTMDFVNADLVYVIKILAKEMRRNVYIGPGADGQVTVSLRDVPPRVALDMILKMHEPDMVYKLAAYNTLIVATPDKIGQIDDDLNVNCWSRQRVPTDMVRQEILLERAPAAKVIAYLQGQYKNVEFIPHPIMNGFYAVGSRSDIVALKNDVPNLDCIPEPPPPPETQFVKITYGDLNEVKSLLANLVPDVQMTVENGGITLLGSHGAVEQAMELLDQLDKPLDQLVIECKMVQMTQVAQRNLHLHWTSITAACAPPWHQNWERVTFSLAGAAIPQTDLEWAPQSGFEGFPESQPSSPGLRIAVLEQTGLGLQANLNDLISQNQCRVLASPRVAAQSGTEAQIHIGDTYPIVYFDPPSCQFRQTSVDLGLKLNITANVKADGYVICKILPEVTTLVSQRYPLARVTRTTTDARLKDGETLALAGLFEDQANPLLADMPILGPLYRPAVPPQETLLLLIPQIMK